MCWWFEPFKRQLCTDPGYTVCQRRYRERKKAKANELKSAVSCLQDKVQELSMVHAEKSELQVRQPLPRNDCSQPWAVASNQGEVASPEEFSGSLHRPVPSLPYGPLDAFRGVRVIS